MARINFLRGVPADEALDPVARAIGKEYGRILEEYGGRIVQYQTPGLTDFNGFVPLKRVLARRFGVEDDPQRRVICTNGGMETFSLLLKSLPRGSRVATDALTYDRALSDVQRNGFETIGVAIGKDGTDLLALEETLSRQPTEVFYQIAYHQSPSGITTTSENLQAASEICARFGTLHVMDVAYYELRYDGQRNQCIDFNACPETTAVVGSFTKTLSPGSKCGFGIFPERIVETMSPIIANTRLNPNYPTQAAIHGLIVSGFYDRHLEFLADLYRPRMETVNRSLARELPEVEVPELTGGFFIGISLPGIQEEAAFIEAASQNDVVLAPAQVFAPGWKERYQRQRGGVFFRLTFPAHSSAENEEGIARIARAYRELR